MAADERWQFAWLQNEMNRVKARRDFLKKAVGYFAKRPDVSSPLSGATCG